MRLGVSMILLAANFKPAQRPFITPIIYSRIKRSVFDLDPVITQPLFHHFCAIPAAQE
jgi:hypothetical protein